MRDSARQIGKAVAALALAAALCAALHPAVHSLQDPDHAERDCIACQVAHGAGLPCAAPVPAIAPAPVEVVQAPVWVPALRPRFHVGHPRGPPV